ncbi:hypothetical protein [Yinghuangia seranimata]|uniref:hypothetical protein n=1 Tax=Yinghuangia seranimata TaxID=408067 RepID=UPI00248CA575|nr:hypothetical protein [Yinghuangia seranimata]MDI2127213.1 hypothetical protein [Yinghuangia seranimata]
MLLKYARPARPRIRIGAVPLAACALALAVPPAAAVHAPAATPAVSVPGAAVLAGSSCGMTELLSRVLFFVPDLLGRHCPCACARPAAEVMPAPGVTVIQQESTSGGGPVNQDNTVNIGGSPPAPPAPPPPTPVPDRPVPSRTPPPRALPAAQAPDLPPLVEPEPSETPATSPAPTPPMPAVPRMPATAAKAEEPDDDSGGWDLITWLGGALVLAIVPAALAAVGHGANSRGGPGRPS